jgi:tellurite methyltransferase
VIVQRAITGFHQDEAGDWVAKLRCGHGQHVRHRPPFWVREWVLTQEGRASRIGVELSCVLCDRFELPAGHVAYKRTRDFDQDSIPDGLRADHSTKPGVWGVIHVLAGRLRYIVEPPLACERMLEPGVTGIVVPEVLHRVVPDGEVRFFVEFHRGDTAE